MLWRRLIGGLVRASAAAALAASGPLAAPANGALAHGARHRHGRVGACQLSLAVPRAPLSAGEAVTVFGRLGCPQAAVAGQTVTLFARAAGTPAFTILASATTEADGAYEVQLTDVSASSVLYATSAAATSPRRTLKVAPLVTLTGPPEGTRLVSGPADYVPPVAYDEARDRVTFTGTVAPADYGAILVLQRERPGAQEEWTQIADGHVGPRGSFAIAHNFRVPGQADIRVVVRAHRVGAVRYAASASAPLSYEITQAQNPRLTINTSGDPIIAGRAVVISGLLAHGPHQAITLYTSPRGGASYTPIASSTTDGSGRYSFSASPGAYTIYWVTGAGQGSAVLAQLVKYSLTAQPSTASVNVGQPLTVTGTISPSRAGQPVYLERTNRSGVGFHVIDVGYATAAGSYSIAHAFYGPGAERLRVKADGDATQSGTASAPFELTVTPVAASLLGGGEPLAEG